MPVEEGDKYIRVRVRDPGDFVDNSFRTVNLSEDQGIYSVMGKLKSDPNGSMVVQNYMFLKSKGWTEEKATKWVSDHKEKKSLRIKPMSDESKQDFMDRCMTDEMMKDSHPGENDRKQACMMAWDEMEGMMEGKSAINNRLERMVMAQSELRVLDVDVGKLGKQSKLAGYAAVFNELSEDFFGMREKIARGAFAKSIKEDDVRMLWNHDPNYILARTKSGTLKLWEDDKGLAFEAIPPDTQFANDLIKSIRRGDVSQNSFGFTVRKHNFDEEKRVRTLQDVRLYDVSPVVFPAYPQTEVWVRSRGGEKRIVLEELKEDKREELKRFFSAPGIYSVGQPNPEGFLSDNSDRDKGDGSANVVIPQPPIAPLVDPGRYRATKTKIGRYLKNGPEGMSG